jgi:hypothetical protein
MSFWSFIFGMAVGTTIGFCLFAIMDAGKRADQVAEEIHEQLLRREP